MKIWIEAKVANMQVGVHDVSLDEATNFIKWVYGLESGEERQAIIMADKPAPAKPEAEDDIPFDVPPAPAAAVTVADAVAAVKEFAAKTNPAKARELMQTVGINRTNEITDANAAQVLELFKGAA